MTAGIAPSAEGESVDAVRAVFDATTSFTVGLEEEVVLVDRSRHGPAPVAAEVVEAAATPGIKAELPACQVELMTAPHPTLDAALAELAAHRRRLAIACSGGVAPVAAAVHPTAPADTEISPSARHRDIEREFGELARRQLVSALQVHVALGDADRTLAVYNALRGYLPEIAALAAAAPFHEGRDTGLASIRPIVAGQLPRQGVPPPIPSWEAYVDDMRWGRASGAVPEPRRWWWELRPHAVHGTLEVRVPDVQPTGAAAAAVAHVVLALVGHLAALHDEGRPLGAPATWRIAENRWQAIRSGVHGHLADLVTGEVVPARRRLHGLFDAIEARVPDGLDQARTLVDHNSADQLRLVGIDRAVPWLVEAFDV